MKYFSITLVFLLSSFLLYAQKHTFEIDTVFKSKDSVVVFVKEFMDSTLVKSFYGNFNDSSDRKVANGRTLREYRFGRKWNIKEFNWKEKYPGLRDSEAEPVFVKYID